MKLGLNESERLVFANMMNKRVVPCNALQNPEMEQVIRFFSQDLKMWCTGEIEKARVQRQKYPGRPFCQNEPELTRLALKQMRELELTAIPSDKDSGFVLMKLCDISALHEEILVVKGYNEITLHDINLLSMSKSLWK